MITDYFIFGRRRGDIALMVDFTKGRLLVRTNTAFMPGGFGLEPIPPGIGGFSPGMVLVKNGWRRQYFLVERKGWTPDDYFIHAAKLLGQQGIVQP